MNKLIITAALTGSVPTKQQNPHLPITPEEIAESACRCREAGASIVHIHARDSDGRATHDSDMFEATCRQIRASCPEIIIQISTGGGAGLDPDRRAAAVRRLKPEMASLTTGSVNFTDHIFENSNELVEYYARVEQEAGARPEMEVFGTGMIATGLMLAERGVLAE